MISFQEFQTLRELEKTPKVTTKDSESFLINSLLRKNLIDKNKKEIDGKKKVEYSVNLMGKSEANIFSLAGRLKRADEY